MAHIHTPVDHFLLSQCESFCMSRSVFLLYRQSCHQDFAPTSSISFLGTYLLFFCKNVSSKSSGTNPQRKAVEVSNTAISLSRKILRLAVERTFEHKLFFFCWYPQLSTKLFLSVLRTTKKLNAQFRSTNRPGTHLQKSSNLEKNRLDLPAATISGQPSNVHVVEIACPSFFSLSCSSLQLVTPKHPFCSSSDSILCRIWGRRCGSGGGGGGQGLAPPPPQPWTRPHLAPHCTGSPGKILGASVNKLALIGREKGNPQFWEFSPDRDWNFRLSRNCMHAAGTVTSLSRSEQ